MIAAAAHAAAVPPPTFVKDVAPILYARCTPCHQPDGDGPFSLVTYDEARRRARLIAEVTAKRYMPPWKPSSDSPAFVGDRRLSEAEIAVIDRWVAGGAPEGRPDDLPPPPARAGAWRWGAPDAVIALPTYTLRADGADAFRNFVVPVPGSGTHRVRALQFRPRSRAVHHANIRVDRTRASRALDEADPEPGYEGVILHSAEFPEGHFLGWTPGQAAPPDDGVAWTLGEGSDLVVQLHLRPTGRIEKVSPLIGLYFTDAPARRPPAMLRLGRQNLTIPAGAADHRVTDAFVLPVGAAVAAVQPHAHYRARDVRATATLPDGTRRLLLHIPDWDFNWQDQYRLRQPIWLPAGTTLAMAYAFDNSANNQRNPTRPPARAEWGWRSSDEMADVWIQLLTQSDADRGMLVEAARLKMTAEDAVGAEVLVAREPNHVNLRNDAALIYRELGQPRKALEHFEAVARLEPRSAAAQYNVAVTLEELGRDEEALAGYQEALRLDGSYALAHNALANRWSRLRRPDEAIREYREALIADPGFAMARCSLARALTETGRPADAANEYRTALASAADAVPCLINFAWLLSAHRDQQIRKPEEGIELAQLAVRLTEGSGEALDVLAAAHAAAGQFAEAVRTAESAVRRFAQDRAVDREREARARLALYKRNVAFVIDDR